MARYGVFVLVAFLSVLIFVQGDYRTKLRNHFTPLGISCFTEYSISSQDIEALNSFQVPKGKEAACFFACVLKKAKLLDSEGMINVAGALELSEKLFKDEDDLTTLVSTFQECLSVNDKPVSDGKKGCERAKLLLVCLKEQEDKSISKTAGGNGQDGPRNVDKTRPKESFPMDSDSDRNPLRRVFQDVFRTAFHISCLPLDKDFFTGRIISAIFPRIDLINSLCASI